MEETAIKELWKSYNDRLEASLQLNIKNTEDISKMKVHNLLSSMKPIKIFTILAGIVWVGFGAVILTNLFIYAFEKVSLFFLFSAAIQVSLTAIALMIYVYQLILIYQVDISEPILETQERLASLRSSTLWVARILFLQFPMWTTFYWSKGMFVYGNVFLIAIQIIVTLSFFGLAIWLFRNIKYENRNKKWFRLIFEGNEWTPVIKSMELLNQLDEYKINYSSPGDRTNT